MTHPFCRFCTEALRRSPSLEIVVGRDANTGLPYACTRDHLDPMVPGRLEKLAAHLRNIFADTVPGVVIYERRKSHDPGSELYPLSDYEKTHAVAWWSPLRVPHNVPGISAGMSLLPPQFNNEIVDVVQRYVGYFHGKEVVIENTFGAIRATLGKKAWREPHVVRDDCEFCQKMTDESVRKRIMAFQYAMDLEVTRNNNLLPGYPDRRDFPVFDPGAWFEAVDKWYEKFKQRDDRRPLLAYPLHELPLRIQRKICIEWNHIWKRWIDKKPELRVFLSDYEDDGALVRGELDSVLDLIDEIQSSA